MKSRPRVKLNIIKSILLLSIGSPFAYFGGGNILTFLLPAILGQASYSFNADLSTLNGLKTVFLFSVGFIVIGLTLAALYSWGYAMIISALRGLNKNLVGIKGGVLSYNFIKIYMDSYKTTSFWVVAFSTIMFNLILNDHIQKLFN